MDKNLVSVIITTHNRYNYLCRAIDSVLSQSYKNIEIIVVDDYSNDETEKNIQKYLGKIKYIRNSKNLGLPASRNVGIREASGDYISFLDDDDELLPEKIEKQIHLLSTSRDVKVVYCGSFKKYRDTVIENLPLLRGNIFPEVLNSTPNAIHTLLIDRNCFTEIGLFDESLKHLEDFDFWIRLSKKYFFAYVEECLVIYNIHGIQMSTRQGEAVIGRDKILQKHQADFQNHKKYYYRHLRRQASKSAVMDDYKAFYRYLVKAIMIRPFILGSYVHLVLPVISRKIHKLLIFKFGIKKIGGIVTF